LRVEGFCCGVSAPGDGRREIREKREIPGNEGVMGKEIRIKSKIKITSKRGTAGGATMREQGELARRVRAG
jgi:hypothetical protein